MGLRPAEFYDLTWADYQRACLGYRVRMDRGWDYTRHIMAAAIGATSTKRVKPTDFYKCIFDDNNFERISPERWEEIKQLLKLN